MDEKRGIDLTKLYKKQISMTEWFENIKHKKTESLRKEDNEKRDRLKELNEIIDLPYDKPFSFLAIDLVNKNEKFSRFLEKHGEELCALRLIPLEKGLPKLRMRGHKIKDVMNWFKEQKIDVKKYKADFVPHLESYLWSSIFIVNSKGIFGEVIKGGHYQLTQGFYDSGKPIAFAYDFNELELSDEDSEARSHIKEIINRIFVGDLQKKEKIKERLNGLFCNNYLKGYFETVKSVEEGLWFIDYNQTLSDLYDGFLPVFKLNEESLLKGRGVSSGRVTGRVRLVNYDVLDVSSDEILVCDMTTPDYFVLMQKCAGIITNVGGMLSHAAIVSRELGKPCVVGTERATEFLKDGDLVEIDADNNLVKKLS